MSRTHVHFASGYPNNKIISGARADADVFIEIDKTGQFITLKSHDKCILGSNFGNIFVIIRFFIFLVII
jgi:hypothetical protein